MTTELILLVDDDATIREFVSQVLEEEGYRIVMAQNGIEALRQLADRQPALILLDIHMPLMTGWEFAQVYRQQPPPHVPIIVMTAGHAANEVAAAIGANGSLAKPFDIDELIAVVARTIADAQ